MPSVPPKRIPRFSSTRSEAALPSCATPLTAVTAVWLGKYSTVAVVAWVGYPRPRNRSATAYTTSRLAVGKPVLIPLQHNPASWPLRSSTMETRRFRSPRGWPRGAARQVSLALRQLVLQQPRLALGEGHLPTRQARVPGPIRGGPARHPDDRGGETRPLLPCHETVP